MKDIHLVGATLLDAILQLESKKEMLGSTERLKLKSLRMNLEAVAAKAHGTDEDFGQVRHVRSVKPYLARIDDKVRDLQALAATLQVQARVLRSKSRQQSFLHQATLEAAVMMISQSHDTYSRSVDLFSRLETSKAHIWAVLNVWGHPGR